MATVINVPRHDPWYSGVGQGISDVITKQVDLNLTDAFAEKKKAQFNANVAALQKAGDRQKAFDLVVTGNMARSPEEILEYAKAIDRIYPETTYADVQAVDSQGIMTNMRVPQEQLLNPEAFSVANPGKRLARPGEKMQMWYSAEGTPLWESTDRPSYSSGDARAAGYTLEELRFRQSQEKDAAEARARRSDIYDENGAMRTEAETLMDKTILNYITDQDELGNRSRPNPKIYSQIRDQALALLQAPGNEKLPITKAVGDAATSVLQQNKVAFPTTPKQRDEFVDFVNEAQFAVGEIDKNLLQTGKAIGVTRTAQSLWNFIQGQTFELGTEIAFPETEEARKRMAILERSLTAALVENPRMPVAEQEFARQYIPKADEWFAAPQQAAEKMRALRERLVSRSNFASERIRQSSPGGEYFQPPAFGKTSDIIRGMTPAQLREIDVNILNQDERAALWEMLDKMGVPKR